MFQRHGRRVCYRASLTTPECLCVCMPTGCRITHKEASMLSSKLGVENLLSLCTLTENVIFPETERKVVLRPF